MSVYQRYFRITEGPVVDEIARLIELRSAAGKLYKELGDKYGASQVNNYERNGQFAGFFFKERPDTTVYRLIQKHRMWVPRRRGPGAEIWKEIESLPCPEPIENALKLVELTPGIPCLTHGNRWYAPTVWGYSAPTPIWYISVPWKDVDPEKLEQYKIDRAAKTTFDRSLDHLLWEVPAGWTEVKRWQIEKEAEEIDAAAAAGGAE